MKFEIAQKWVEALRSGQYTQAKKTLKTVEGSMCCLGVLCNLYDPKGWSSDVETFTALTEEGNPEKLIGFNSFVDSNGEKESSFLPKEVSDWAGMISHTGYVGNVSTDDVPAGHIDLPELNDTVGWDFKAIASFVEKYWEQM